MGWFTKMVGIDKVIQQKIDKVFKGTVIPTNVLNPKLLEYRMLEYRAWASSSTDALLTFYKQKTEPTTNDDRLAFWQWIGGINVPKVHYPAPEIILSHIKGILFSGELIFEASNDKASKEKLDEMTERIESMIKDVNIDDFTANGSLFETYSGSVACKVVMDASVHDKPILQQYPRERFDIVEKYGKTLEIIFKDDYYVKNKKYLLKSIYGKGFIKYELYLNDKEVPLDTIDDTKDLFDVSFNNKIILATWKKNKTVSNEFPELVYGGSDFEGITDIFHSVDEIFSSLMLYIRRNRPVMGVDESLLPVSNDGSRTIIPKEYEFDMLKFRNNESNKDKIYRDNPEIKTEAFMTSINELMVAAFQKITLSQATVDDSSVGANQSGEAIGKREKSTSTLRDSKIKLWIPYLAEVQRLYLMADDVMQSKVFNQEHYTFTEEYKDWTFKTDFPDYNGQTFAEKVKELSEAKREGLIDTATAIDKLYGRELTEDEKKIMVRNSKLESGAVLLEEDVIDLGA